MGYIMFFIGEHIEENKKSIEKLREDSALIAVSHLLLDLENHIIELDEHGQEVRRFKIKVT